MQLVCLRGTSRVSTGIKYPCQTALTNSLAARAALFKAAKDSTDKDGTCVENKGDLRRKAEGPLYIENLRRAVSPVQTAGNELLSGFCFRLGSPADGLPDSRDCN